MTDWVSDWWKFRDLGLLGGLMLADAVTRGEAKHSGTYLEKVYYDWELFLRHRADMLRPE
jgi:hypothetical protein